MTRSRSAQHILAAAAVAGFAFIAGGCFLQGTLDTVTGADDGLLTVEGDPAVAMTADDRLRVTVTFSLPIYAPSVIADTTILVATLQGVPITGTPVTDDDQIVWTATDALTLTPGSQLQLTLVGSPQLHGGVGVIQAQGTRDGVVTPGTALDGNGDGQPYGDYTFTFAVPAA